MIRYIESVHQMDKNTNIDCYIFQHNTKKIIVTLRHGPTLEMVINGKGDNREWVIVYKWYDMKQMCYRCSTDKRKLNAYISKIPETQIAVDCLKNQRLAIMIREQFWLK